jgi:hypothetical protein
VGSNEKSTRPSDGARERDTEGSTGQGMRPLAQSGADSILVRGGPRGPGRANGLPAHSPTAVGIGLEPGSRKQFCGPDAQAGGDLHERVDVTLHSPRSIAPWLLRQRPARTAKAS